jgi:hypothetical protein
VDGRKPRPSTRPDSRTLEADLSAAGAAFAFWPPVLDEADTSALR